MEHHSLSCLKSSLQLLGTSICMLVKLFFSSFDLHIQYTLFSACQLFSNFQKTFYTWLSTEVIYQTVINFFQSVLIDLSQYLSRKTTNKKCYFELFLQRESQRRYNRSGGTCRYVFVPDNMFLLNLYSWENVALY